jgi:hypothetical protein
MFERNVSKGVKIITLIVKVLKFNVEHGSVVTRKDIMKHTTHILCYYLIAELARSFCG